MALTPLQKNPDNRAWSGVIASGQSLSDAFPLGGRRFVKIQSPDITSATLSFQVQVYPGGDFQDLYDDAGNELTVGSAFTTARTFDMPWLAGLFAVKIRSGTSGSPVNQGADRTFVVAVSSRG